MYMKYRNLRYTEYYIEKFSEGNDGSGKKGVRKKPTILLTVSTCLSQRLPLIYNPIAKRKLSNVTLHLLLNIFFE